MQTTEIQNAQKSKTGIQVEQQDEAQGQKMQDMSVTRPGHKT